MEKRSKYILKPIINLILYDMLLVATPFLMLQNYLQQSVNQFGRWKINIIGLDLPVALSVFVFIVLIVLILN